MILRRAAAVFIATIALAPIVSTATPAAADHTSRHSSSHSATDDQAVVVTVPLLPYEAHHDDFRVGPYRSRLHVLHNDAGNPDPSRLTLLDRSGRTVTSLWLHRVGRVSVANGYVVLDPVERPDGRGTFTYQAASGNGELQTARARIQMVPEVIRVRNDRASSRPGIPLVLDVTANDRIVVPGAERVCAPMLTAQPRSPADPLPIVLPEPEHLPFPCADLTGGVPGAGAVLVTPAGRWAVDELGRVSFAPTPDFHGTATAFYRQAADRPFDLGVGRMTVRVLAPGDTEVLGVKNGGGSKGSTPPMASPDDGGSGIGALPRTGAEIAATLLIGAGLVGAGTGLVRVGRRRRQARALDA